ncbi:MAG: hypothetical protein DMF69_09630 [Acidobacteria bacterium]|nr:MAG: hypothetical protein DMF69_09630 [Acidobacteriota bacterium]
MSRRLVFIIISLASFLVLGSVVQAQSPRTLPIDDYKPVTIPGAHIRTLSSTNTKRDYDIYIHLPNATPQNAGKKYPVLYLLDGQWDFKLLDSVYGGLYYDKFVPEMIIIGITYSGPNPNYDLLRSYDYTPVAEADRPGTGDGPKFLAFLKNELFPMIEKNYPCLRSTQCSLSRACALDTWLPVRQRCTARDFSSPRNLNTPPGERICQSNSSYRWVRLRT